MPYRPPPPLQSCPSDAGVTSKDGRGQPHRLSQDPPPVVASLCHHLHCQAPHPASAVLFLCFFTCVFATVYRGPSDSCYFAASLPVLRWGASVSTVLRSAASPMVWFTLPRHQSRTWPVANWLMSGFCMLEKHLRHCRFEKASSTKLHSFCSCSQNLEGQGSWQQQRRQ